MAIINSYPEIGALATGDLLTVVDVSNDNKTNTLEIGDLSSYIITTSSLANGSGSAKSMVMWSDADTLADCGPVTLVQEQEGANTLTVGSGDDQTVIFEANIEFQAGVKDSTGALGTAGQVLSSSGSNSVWTSALGVSTFSISDVEEYNDNADAITGGESIGTVYRTGDLLKIVH